MVVTVRGRYENGVVRLEEPAPAAAQTAQVLVTFLTSKTTRPSRAKSPKKPRFSFDEALALTADTSHVEVAAEVEAEREEERQYAIF